MMPDIPPKPANPADPAPEFPWPNGKRCAVLPAFDVDAESAWLQHDVKNTDRLVTMSFGGYEERVGVPNILDYLRSVEIKATFFLRGWVVEAIQDVREAIVRDGHEIGHHGYLHKRPDPADFAEDKEEVDKAFEAFKRVLGVTPSATALPPPRTMTSCSAICATAASSTPPPSATISAPTGTSCATARRGRSNFPSTCPSTTGSTAVAALFAAPDVPEGACAFDLER